MKRKRRFKKKNPYATNMNLAFVFFISILVFFKFNTFALIGALAIPFTAVYIMSPSSKILRLHKKKKNEWASIGVRKNAPLRNPHLACVLISVITVAVYILRYDYVITNMIIQILWGEVKSAYIDVFGHNSANSIFLKKYIPVYSYYILNIIHSCTAFFIVTYSASVYFRYKQQTMFKKVLLNAAHHNDALGFIRELSWREFE
uniref:hypothetical protein n=1 Tax=Photorhabdus sp. RM322S TaxID=3342825 RepID=UPI0036D78F54